MSFNIVPAQAGTHSTYGQSWLMLLQVQLNGAMGSRLRENDVGNYSALQPPPSTRYKATWFCKRCKLACTAACWALNKDRWASSKSR